MAEKYVWLNLETGEFSNSWTKEEMDVHGGVEKILPETKDTRWKLIKFECLNDDDFEFMHLMRIR